MARYSTALWDTIWSTDPALGTIGDWAIAPSADDQPVITPLDDEEELVVVSVPNSGGLKNVDPIGTAVLLCIASDARLPDWMVGRFGFTIDDQHEWHGNTTAMEPGEEPLGSLLWILRRAPLSNYTAKMAEHFCADALQVMVRNGVINSVEVVAEVNKVMGRLDIYIRVWADEGERIFKHDLYPMQ